MKLSSPLFILYDEEMVYNALRERIPLPKYVKGSYYVTEECAAAVAAMDLREQGDTVYDAFYQVHEEVRKSLPAQRMLLDEVSRYGSNVFLELPLAGYEVFGVLAHLAAPILQVAGFELDKTFSISGFTKQVGEIEVIDLQHMPLLTNVYLEKRREFIERHDIADESDLRDYIAEMSHDVFGVIYGAQNCAPEHQQVRYQIANRMYHDGEESIVYTYGVTRCALRANGGGAPINKW